MTKTITRADLSDAVYRELGFSHAESLKLVDSIFQVAVETLSKGEELKVSGFASFIPHQKVARIGRNPKTGVEAVISSRRVISFKPSQTMRKIINQ